jgi:branched-chain amino acid transport system permease protein
MRGFSRIGLARTAIFFAVLMIIPLVGAPGFLLNTLIFTVMYAALASSWNLVGGYAGYPSLGHAAFFGIGAYSVGLIFSKDVSGGYVPFLVLPLIGIAVGLLAIPIGWVSMRTRSDVFAIVTITLLFITQTLAFNLKGLTGGAQGTSVAPPPFAVDTFDWPFYFAMLTLLALAMGISLYFRRSKIGLSLATVRADEDKAHGVGVRVTAVKLIAFAVSAGLAAMVGGVWAYYVGFIYPQFAIDPLITIGMVLMAFLGGRGTLWGPVLGAFILVPAQEFFAQSLGASQLYLFAYAAVFLVIILFLPRGILPSITERLKRRRDGALDAASAGAAVPTATREVKVQR